MTETGGQSDPWRAREAADFRERLEGFRYQARELEAFLRERVVLDEWRGPAAERFRAEHEEACRGSARAVDELGRALVGVGQLQLLLGGRAG